MPVSNKCLPGSWPLKVIRARYGPEPNSMTFSKGSDDTDIILEAEFYFKADVDALFAKMSEEIKGLNEYITHAGWNAGKGMNMATIVCSNVNGRNIQVNGRTIQVPPGSSITIDGDKIIIGDNELVIKDKVINISIEGTVGSASTSSGSIKVTGSSGNLTTSSGDISVGGNAGNITTMSGDVDVKGSVSGNISTMSGDVSHH